MRKLSKIIALTATAALLMTGLVGCGENKQSSSEAAATTAAETTIKAVATKEIKLGVCAGPYGDLFTDAITPSLEEKGYTVKIVEFSDYVQPNKALANKETDVNLFQHSTYLKKFSADNGLDLTAITEVPTVSMGVYSDKYKSIDELPEGATVTIPDDPTNLTRALKVLQAAKLITIDPKADPTLATEKDLSENTKNLKFTLIEAAQLPRTLDSADIAVVNGNFAVSAGLDPAKALFNETLTDGYLNVIAVRTEDKDSDLAKAIVSIVHSDAFRAVIDAKDGPYAGFQKPKGYND